jgi:ribosomal protein S27AE
MAYEKIQCTSITCDNCGEGYLDEQTGFSLFVSESDADEAADNDNWYTGHLKGEHEDKHYCPKCYEMDEEVDDKLTVITKWGSPEGESIEDEFTVL